MRVEAKSPWVSSGNLCLGRFLCIATLLHQGCVTSYVVSSEPIKEQSSTLDQTVQTTTSLTSTDPKTSTASPSTPGTTSSTVETGQSESASSLDQESTGALPDCPGKKIRCGLLCVDVRNDAQHCGGCFVGCGAPASCILGQCLRACDPGCRDDEDCTEENLCVCKDAKTHCGAECVDLGSSSAHCGACGHACLASQKCISGQCRS